MTSMNIAETPQTHEHQNKPGSVRFAKYAVALLLTLFWLAGPFHITLAHADATWSSSSSSSGSNGIVVRDSSGNLEETGLSLNDINKMSSQIDDLQRTINRMESMEGDTDAKRMVLELRERNKRLTERVTRLEARLNALEKKR